MSYKYLTQFSSPNYTPEASARAVYGRPRTYEAISVHHWGDPSTNPTFEGVLNHLCNKASGVSAHFVATATDRRVACLVNLNDISWATVQANPFTISIECDPRCRPEDYDVVAELIADIRSAYGNLPLVPHSKYIATRCPGNWDLGRLNALAANKVSQKEWGQVTNKVELATADQINALYNELLGRNADPGGVLTYTQQTVSQARANIMASPEYHNRQQALSEQAARAAAEKVAADEAAKAEAEKQSAAVPTSPAPGPVAVPPTQNVPTPAPVPTTPEPTKTPTVNTPKPNLIVLIISAIIRALSTFKKK